MINMNNFIDVFDSIQNSFVEMIACKAYSNLEAEFLLLKPGEPIGIIGVGKNYLTAKRVALTLNSLGHHAMAVSAEEALHGSLANMHNMKFVIAFSKSGTTTSLIQVLKELDGYVPKYGFTFNLHDCKLDEYSKVIRPQSVLIKEFDVYDLLPTSSIIVFQMLIEWLAYIAFAKGKDNIPDYLNKFHPGR
jgi:glucosamine 6-phosphate synthetase-like amidotransferase/phosphosugar isomerase protein